MNDALTPEELQTIRHCAEESCECPEIARLIADEVPRILCGPCKARRWLEEGKMLAEELS